MTLDEAISILAREQKEHHSFRTDVIGQAELLGIEALKRLGEIRATTGLYTKKLLPGETE